MLPFFKYNWQVRADYFDLLRTVPYEEIYKKRIGGVGSIAYTLYHIIDVEYNWLITDLNQQPEIEWHFEDFKSLMDIQRFSEERHPTVAAFVAQYTEGGDEQKLLTSEKPPLKYGEVMRHVIAHEIHHIGQLSIWVRELDLKPPTANFIRRDFF
jgi:uncharacterized damage-inducible protein DinB